MQLSAVPLAGHERIVFDNRLLELGHVLLATLDGRCAAIFREHPFHDSPDLVPALRQLLTTSEFTRATEVS